MFPNPDRREPEFPEGGVRAPVPLPVLPDFRFPEFPVGPREPEVLGATVPETGIREHRDPEAFQDEIRRSRQVPGLFLELEPQGEEGFADSRFQFRPAGLDRPHDPAARFGVHPVHDGILYHRSAWMSRGPAANPLRGDMCPFTLDNPPRKLYIISGREAEMNKLVEVMKRAKAEGDRQELYQAVEDLVMVLEGYGLERAQTAFMRFFLAGGKPEQALRSAELAVKRLRGRSSLRL